MPTQTTTRFRVIMITMDNLGPTTRTSEAVKWEGDNIADLSLLYPRVLSTDPLGHSEIEDGLIRFDHRFEQLLDGEWVQIDDPRVLSNLVHRARERAIDEENRRLFTGDYFDEEDGTLCGICCRDLTDCDC